MPGSNMPVHIVFSGLTIALPLRKPAVSHRTVILQRRRRCLGMGGLTVATEILPVLKAPPTSAFEWRIMLSTMPIELVRLVKPF